MDADLRIGQSFATAGYRVLPFRRNKKFCGKNGWKDIQADDAVAEEFRRDLFSGDQTITGCGVVLGRKDPRPLLIVDVDQPNKMKPLDSEELAEKALGEWPKDVPYVLTPNKGIHFYFSLPQKIRLHAGMDLGGIHCDVRYSYQPKPLVLALPGSVIKIGEGAKRRYEPCSDDAFLSWSTAGLQAPEFPLPPHTLLERLAARSESAEEHTTAGDAVKLPTEALAMLRLLPTLQPGERNNRLADIGLVLGRIAPYERIPSNVRAQVLELLMPKLAQPEGDTIDQAEVWGVIARRWREGLKNWRIHTQPRLSKAPTIEAVEEEARVLWGEMPKFHRLLEAERTTGWLAKIKEKEVIVSAADLPRLAQRISDALGRREAHAASPLFTQRAWLHTFCELVVRSTAEDIIVGINLRDKFIEEIGGYAEMAAKVHKFVRNPYALVGEQKQVFLLVDATRGPEFVVIPRRVKESLMSRFDMEVRADAWKLFEKAAVKIRVSKYRTVMDGIPIADLEPEVRESIVQTWKEWAKENVRGK